VARRPLPRQAGAGDAVLGEEEVEDGGDEPAADLADGHPAAQHPGPTDVEPDVAALLAGHDVEAREEDLDGARPVPVDRQERLATLEVEVPAALALLTEAPPEGPVRDERGAAAVEQAGLQRRVR